MDTKIWKDAKRGLHYLEGPDGCLLNGQPVGSRPAWVTGDPDEVYGPVIPWGGGECPVAPDTPVRMIFRNRAPYTGKAIWPAMPDDMKASIWQHAPFKGRPRPDADIIAYQVRVA